MPAQMLTIGMMHAKMTVHAERLVTLRDRVLKNGGSVAEREELERREGIVKTLVAEYGSR